MNIIYPKDMTLIEAAKRAERSGYRLTTDRRGRLALQVIATLAVHALFGTVLALAIFS